MTAFQRSKRVIKIEQKKKITFILGFFFFFVKHAERETRPRKMATETKTLRDCYSDRSQKSRAFERGFFVASCRTRHDLSVCFRKLLSRLNVKSQKIIRNTWSLMSKSSAEYSNGRGGKKKKSLGTRSIQFIA